MASRGRTCDTGQLMPPDKKVRSLASESAYSRLLAQAAVEAEATAVAISRIQAARSLVAGGAPTAFALEGSSNGDSGPDVNHVGHTKPIKPNLEARAENAAPSSVDSIGLDVDPSRSVENLRQQLQQLQQFQLQLLQHQQGAFGRNEASSPPFGGAGVGLHHFRSSSVGTSLFDSRVGLDKHRKFLRPLILSFHSEKGGGGVRQ